MHTLPQFAVRPLALAPVAPFARSVRTFAVARAVVRGAGELPRGGPRPAAARNGAAMLGRAARADWATLAGWAAAALYAAVAGYRAADRFAAARALRASAENHLHCVDYSRRRAAQLGRWLREGVALRRAPQKGAARLLNPFHAHLEPGPLPGAPHGRLHVRPEHGPFALVEDTGTALLRSAASGALWPLELAAGRAEAAQLRAAARECLFLPLRHAEEIDRVLAAAAATLFGSPHNLADVFEL